MKKEFNGFNPNRKTKRKLERYFKLMQEEISLSSEEKEKIKKEIFKNENK